MKKKGEGDKDGRIRKTISFERRAFEIIEAYRSKKQVIPSFTKAVNEIIKESKKRG